MTKGGELLLRHCATLDEPGEPRTPARERLAAIVGEELGRRLRRALTYRLRSSSWPYSRM